MLQFIAKLKHKLEIAAGECFQFKIQLKRKQHCLQFPLEYQLFLFQKDFIISYCYVWICSLSFLHDSLNWFLALQGFDHQGHKSTVPPFFLHLFPLHAMFSPHLLLFLILRNFMVVSNSHIQTVRVASDLISLLLLFLEQSPVSWRNTFTNNFSSHTWIVVQYVLSFWCVFCILD